MPRMLGMARRPLSRQRQQQVWISKMASRAVSQHVVRVHIDLDFV